MLMAKHEISETAAFAMLARASSGSMEKLLPDESWFFDDAIDALHRALRVARRIR